MEFVKSLFASKLPHRVYVSQVAEWLPDVDSRPIKDRMANEYCLCPPLSALLSAAAESLGDHKRAVEYDHYQLSESPHPVKNTYALIRWGCLTIKIAGAGDSVDNASL